MASYRQDAAPPGGYKDIEWARFYGKKSSGLKILGVILAMKGLGLAWFYVFRKKFKLEKYEDADWRISLMPFYLAENDRLRLKEFRYTRDKEAELMKDVPGWKVGTWKGLELYHNQQRKFDESLHAESFEFQQPAYLWKRISSFFFSRMNKEL